MAVAPTSYDAFDIQHVVWSHNDIHDTNLVWYPKTEDIIPFPVNSKDSKDNVFCRPCPFKCVKISRIDEANPLIGHPSAESATCTLSVSHSLPSSKLHPMIEVLIYYISYDFVFYVYRELMIIDVNKYLISSKVSRCIGLINSTLKVPKTFRLKLIF